MSEQNRTGTDEDEQLSESLSGSLTEKAELATTDDATLDLTRYKTEELKKRFEKLFGVAQLIPWAVGGMGATFTFFLLIWTFLFAPQAGVFIAVISLIYLSFQGFYLGILAASLLIVARLLQQLGAIVDMTIQTLREALHDMKKIGDNRTSRAELTAGLVHGAILPAAQSVITVKMGLLRLPISFVINRVLKRTAKKLTKSLDKKGDSLLDLHADPSDDNIPEHRPPSDQDNDRAGGGHSSTIKKSPGKAETHLDRMQERIDLIARRTRRATLIPATIFFIATALISSIPWILVYLIFLL